MRERGGGAKVEGGRVAAKEGGGEEIGAARVWGRVAPPPPLRPATCPHGPRPKPRLPGISGKPPLNF